MVIQFDCGSISKVSTEWWCFIFHSQCKAELGPPTDTLAAPIPRVEPPKTLHRTQTGWSVLTNSVKLSERLALPSFSSLTALWFPARDLEGRTIGPSPPSPPSPRWSHLHTARCTLTVWQTLAYVSFPQSVWFREQLLGDVGCGYRQMGSAWGANTVMQGLNYTWGSGWCYKHRTASTRQCSAPPVSKTFVPRLNNQCAESFFMIPLQSACFWLVAFFLLSLQVSEAQQKPENKAEGRGNKPLTRWAGSYSAESRRLFSVSARLKTPKTAVTYGRRLQRSENEEGDSAPQGGTVASSPSGGYSPALWSWLLCSSAPSGRTWGTHARPANRLHVGCRQVDTDEWGQRKAERRTYFITVTFGRNLLTSMWRI